MPGKPPMINADRHDVREPTSITRDSAAEHYGELWSQHSLEVFKWNMNQDSPGTMRQWAAMTSSMNCLLRHPLSEQFTSKKVVTKYRELKASNGFEDIADLDYEPNIIYAQPKVQIDLKFWRNNPQVQLSDDNPLQVVRNNFQEWRQRLHNKYKEFWSMGENEKLLHNTIESLVSSPKIFFIRLAATMNEKCQFPQGLQSVEVIELKRKCWEIHNMASKLMVSILGDNNSAKQFHYSGVESREDKSRMAEHEYIHGQCKFLPTPLKSPSKSSVLQNEIVNITLLNKLADFGIIAGCLNESDGGDGKIVGDSVVSNSYSCYEYSTETPYDGKPNTIGSLRLIKEYQKCPKKTYDDGKPIPHWFCFFCHQWIQPQNMKNHTIGHLRVNISCSDQDCKRTFRSNEAMEHHFKMSHILVRCIGKHEKFVKVNSMSLFTFRKFHLPAHHPSELKNRNVT